MLTKDLVAASSKPLLLSILAGGESYGYEIIQKVRELSGGQIEWTIDGKPFLTVNDPTPLVGTDHQYFAFSDWEAPVHFDNLRIEPIS